MKTEFYEIIEKFFNNPDFFIYEEIIGGWKESTHYHVLTKSIYKAYGSFYIDRLFEKSINGKMYYAASGIQHLKTEDII